MANYSNHDVLIEIRRDLAQLLAKMELKYLKQQGSVEEYINHFNSITNNPILSEEFRVYWFVKGLKTEISSVIERMYPSTTHEAMYLARLQEQLLEINSKVNQETQTKVGTNVMNNCAGFSASEFTQDVLSSPATDLNEGGEKPIHTDEAVSPSAGNQENQLEFLPIPTMHGEDANMLPSGIISVACGNCITGQIDNNPSVCEFDEVEDVGMRFLTLNDHGNEESDTSASVRSGICYKVDKLTPGADSTTSGNRSHLSNVQASPSHSGSMFNDGSIANPNVLNEMNHTSVPWIKFPAAGAGHFPVHIPQSSSYVAVSILRNNITTQMNESELLKFDGNEDVRGWISKCETVFIHENTSSYSKVQRATMALDGSALIWHWVYTSQNKEVSWLDYSQAILKRFDRRKYAIRECSGGESHTLISSACTHGSDTSMTTVEERNEAIGNDVGDPVLGTEDNEEVAVNQENQELVVHSKVQIKANERSEDFKGNELAKETTKLLNMFAEKQNFPINACILWKESNNPVNIFLELLLQILRKHVYFDKEIVQLVNEKQDDWCTVIEKSLEIPTSTEMQDSTSFQAKVQLQGYHTMLPGENDDYFSVMQVSLEEFFKSDSISYRMDRNLQAAFKLRYIIDEKFCDSFRDYFDEDALAEYILVLVCNGKNQNQARDELKAYLVNKSANLITWLCNYHVKENYISRASLDSSLNMDVPRGHEVGSNKAIKRFNFCSKIPCQGVHKILKRPLILIWGWYYKDMGFFLRTLIEVIKILVIQRPQYKGHPGTWIKEWKVAWVRCKLHVCLRNCQWHSYDLNLILNKDSGYYHDLFQTKFICQVVPSCARVLHHAANACKNSTEGSAAFKSLRTRILKGERIGAIQNFQTEDSQFFSFNSYQIMAIEYRKFKGHQTAHDQAQGPLASTELLFSSGSSSLQGHSWLYKDSVKKTLLLMQIVVQITVYLYQRLDIRRNQSVLLMPSCIQVRKLPEFATFYTQTCSWKQVFCLCLRPYHGLPLFSKWMNSNPHEETITASYKNITKPVEPPGTREVQRIKERLLIFIWGWYYKDSGSFCKISVGDQGDLNVKSSQHVDHPGNWLEAWKIAWQRFNQHPGNWLKAWKIAWQGSMEYPTVISTKASYTTSISGN